MSETRRTFLKAVGGGALAVNPVLTTFDAAPRSARPPETILAETTHAKLRGDVPRAEPLEY